MKSRFFLYVVLALCFISFSGCTVTLEKGRRTDLAKIKVLEDELAELRDAKNALESQLSTEIGSNDVTVSMGENGINITFVDQVLFDSGRADLKSKSLPILAKVAEILKREASNNNIGIEGHTDNRAIKHSGWKSNWELSAQRALSVLHYMEKQGVNASRMSATGYGEYRAVDTNDTAAGRK